MHPATTATQATPSGANCPTAHGAAVAALSVSDRSEEAVGQRRLISAVERAAAAVLAISAGRTVSDQELRQHALDCAFLMEQAYARFEELHDPADREAGAAVDVAPRRGAEGDEPGLEGRPRGADPAGHHQGAGLLRGGRGCGAGGAGGEESLMLCTARVAPEKAVFRPALPLHQQPEFTGEHMATRKTYAEQLKHPSWQRKRLEVLQAAQFQCDVCGDDQSTLHVHHKRYVKGREVWEYELRELQALCETCHAEHHEAHKLLEEVMAMCDLLDPTRTALGLLAGYATAAYGLDHELSEKARLAAGPAFDVGIAAYAVGMSSMPDLAVAFTSLTKNEVNGPVLEALLEKWAAAKHSGPIREE